MARLNLTAKTKNEKIILNYLDSNASADLIDRINKSEKTLAQCWNYIFSEARKQAKNGCACIADEEVFGWAMHFFEEDEIKAEAYNGVVPAKVKTSDNVENKRSDKPQKINKLKTAEAENCQLTFDDLFG